MPCGLAACLPRVERVTPRSEFGGLAGNSVWAVLGLTSDVCTVTVHNLLKEKSWTVAFRYWVSCI